MIKKIILTTILSLGVMVNLDTTFASSGDVSVMTNCSGTRVVRTEIGRLEITHVEKNLPGCIGGTRTVVSNKGGVMVGSGVVISKNPNRFDPKNGPVLDIRSTDITNYRSLQMKKSGVRYVNPIRSVKMRATASMSGRVSSYLMRNDAVVITGLETGWVKSQGASVSVTDTGSNTVLSATGGKASGYIAAKYLRLPNASDLVRIAQADQAYWSDIAHVNVAHLVNVRAHPWYGSKIKFVLSDKTNLYVVSTVDNWSEVLSDDRKISGYIRSDFLSIDKSQRVDL